MIIQILTLHGNTMNNVIVMLKMINIFLGKHIVTMDVVTKIIVMFLMDIVIGLVNKKKKKKLVDVLLKVDLKHGPLSVIKVVMMKIHVILFHIIADGIYLYFNFNHTLLMFFLFYFLSTLNNLKIYFFLLLLKKILK